MGCFLGAIAFWESNGSVTYYRLWSYDALRTTIKALSAADLPVSVPH
ncbi:MAG: hypothetical protein F6K56_03065 [Moorea sp. SIO3G5]|nr:hypothetical protein [Moorena sp. SIO3G5]